MFWQPLKVLFFLLFALHALYSQTGFIMGNNGTLFRTSNGGTNWANIQTGTTKTLWSSFFITKQTGWIVGGTYGGTSVILKTTDEGINWNAQYIGSNGWLTGAYFLNNQTGFVVGSNGQVLKTINSGTNWNPINIGAGNTLFETINFFDALTGWITGWQGKLYKTINGGDNWTAVASGTSNNLYTTFFKQNGTGWISGSGGVLLKTTNSGNNWTSVQSGASTELFSIFFIDNTGWICGNSGTMLYSANGGDSWNGQLVASNTRLETVHFLTPATGWVVGGFSGSAVFKTTNSGVNWVSQPLSTTQELYSVFFWKDPIGIQTISEVVPDMYTLCQNYPNPFNPSTKIRFEVPQTKNSQNLIIKIYNQMGEELATLVDQKFNPGTYEVDWDAARYSSGIYYYRLLGENFSETKKMTLVK